MKCTIAGCPALMNPVRSSTRRCVPFRAWLRVQMYRFAAVPTGPWLGAVYYLRACKRYYGLMRRSDELRPASAFAKATADRRACSACSVRSLPSRAVRLTFPSLLGHTLATTRPNHPLPRQDFRLQAYPRLKAAHKKLLFAAPAVLTLRGCMLTRVAQHTKQCPHSSNWSGPSIWRRRERLCGESHQAQNSHACPCWTLNRSANHPGLEELPTTSTNAKYPEVPTNHPPLAGLHAQCPATLVVMNINPVTHSAAPFRAGGVARTLQITADMLGARALPARKTPRRLRHRIYAHHHLATSSRQNSAANSAASTCRMKERGIPHRPWAVQLPP